MPIRTIKRLDVAAGGRFEVRADAARKSGELLIYGDIGESWWAEESITAKGVIDALAGIDADLIDVRINSFGGSVADGLAIYNALRRHRAAIATYNDGVAFSAASLILMAGDERRSAENALTMIHAPWGWGTGNARELRDLADTLDKYAEAMAGCYARETGLTRDQALALLKDGEDHYYTAEEAQAAGLIDTVDDALPIAAHFDLSRYPNLPPPAAAFSTPKVHPMPIENTPKPAPASGAPVQNPPVATPAPAAAPPAPSADNVAQIEAAAERRAQERLAERNAAIQMRYSRHLKFDGVPALLAKQLADPAISVEAAANALLDHMADQTGEPIAGRPVPVSQGTDESDKRRGAMAAALLMTVGAADHDRQNPYRGLRLHGIARACLQSAGVRVDGMYPEELASAALTWRHVRGAQTTSDFPVILEAVLHKLVLDGAMAAPITHDKFCRIGNVTDLRAWNRLTPGLIGNLDPVNEHGEYLQKNLPDAEKQSIQATRKGNIISITPEVFINDDLGQVEQQARDLGMAGPRSIERSVYTLLESNPTLSDGTALFHADHGNLAGSGAAPSVATLDAGGLAMSLQTAPGTDAELLDITPEIALCHRGLRGTMYEVINAEFNDEATKNQRRPNSVRGIVSDIVSTGRLASTAAWYLFADPNVSPVIEVVYLNNQREPRIVSEEDFRTAGLSWRIELPYGVGAIGYRGGYKNAGS